MGLWKISWRYLWRQPLVTILTLLGLALGSGLISCVLTLRQETEKTLVNESSIFDLVVGAKGSPLQLVLSSIYHLDIPTGNIPYEQYLAVKKDFRVKTAVPLGLGDNYQGFRIVGTLPEFFDLSRKTPDSSEGKRLFSLKEGTLFTKPFEVVLGADVERQTNLKIGDTFIGSHGIIATAGAAEHKRFPYVVVGILKPSGTSNDRAIFTPLKSVWLVHANEAELHSKMFDKPVENKLEVTSVLVQLNVTGMRFMMLNDINKKTGEMAAVPVNEMLRLYKKVLNPVQKTLLAIAYLVVFVSALSILTALYQSAERRRHDIAIMRSMGAHPNEIFIIVMLEAFFLTIIGLLSGWVLGHALLDIGSHFFRNETGLDISAWVISIIELKAFAVIAIIGIGAGLIPAFFNYRRSPVKDLY